MEHDSGHYIEKNSFCFTRELFFEEFLELLKGNKGIVRTMLIIRDNKGG